jgi:hypothetical protein
MNIESGEVRGHLGAAHIFFEKIHHQMSAGSVITRRELLSDRTS